MILEDGEGDASELAGQSDVSGYLGLASIKQTLTVLVKQNVASSGFRGAVQEPSYFERKRGHAVTVSGDGVGPADIW